MKKQANTTRFFYQNGKLVTVSQAEQYRAIFRCTEMPLAERVDSLSSELLTVDGSESVLGTSARDDDGKASSS